MIYRQEPFHPGFVSEWAADWQVAWQAAEGIIENHLGRVKLLERSTLQVREMLSRDEYWALIAVVADHLLAHETLDQEMVEEILGDWIH